MPPCYESYKKKCGENRGNYRFLPLEIGRCGYSQKGENGRNCGLDKEILKVWQLSDEANLSCLWDTLWVTLWVTLQSILFLHIFPPAEGWSLTLQTGWTLIFKSLTKRSVTHKQLNLTIRASLAPRVALFLLKGPKAPSVPGVTHYFYSRAQRALSCQL